MPQDPEVGIPDYRRALGVHLDSPKIIMATREDTARHNRQGHRDHMDTIRTIISTIK